MASTTTQLKETLQASIDREREKLQHEITSQGEQELLETPGHPHQRVATLRSSEAQDQPASLAEYIHYLTSKNNLFHALRHSFKRRVRLDLIGKSNARSLALVDQLVDEIRGKVQFKDMCA